MTEDAIVIVAILVLFAFLGLLTLVGTVTLAAINKTRDVVLDEESEHYESTACFHGHHDLCRLECKHCASPCRCECHEDDDPRKGLPTKRES